MDVNDSISCWHSCEWLHQCLFGYCRNGQRHSSITILLISLAFILGGLIVVAIDHNLFAMALCFIGGFILCICGLPLWTCQCAEFDLPLRRISDRTEMEWDGASSSIRIALRTRFLCGEETLPDMDEVITIVRPSASLTCESIPPPARSARGIAGSGRFDGFRTFFPHSFTS